MRSWFRLLDSCRQVLLISLISAPAAFASPNYQIDVWRADDGLPQGTVTSIVQTGDGYLWFGTQNGLVRFDGISFKVFTQNSAPAIRNNRIVQLFVDREGALWVGAEQGSLARFYNGEFTFFEMPGNGTAFNYARSLCDDPEGRQWVLSCEWRLMFLAQGKFEVPSASWGLNSVRPDAVASDQAGHVCVGTERELALWTNGTFQTIWSQSDEPGFQADFLATSRAGGWWVAGNGRLRRFESGRWVSDRGAYAWTTHPIYGLYEDRQNRLWVATLGKGLFRYDPDGAILHLTAQDGLPSDFVRCVTEDREGNIWAGTEGSGLCRIKPAVFQTLGTKQGLSSDQTMSMCESSDGTFWVGMNGSGLDHFSHGHVEHFGPERGLSNGHVWSVLEDRKGRLWAGTWGGLFELQGERFNNVADPATIGGVVLALYEDREGSLWLGQQAFGSLTRFKGEERTTFALPGVASSLDVRVMTEDKSGALWVGTEDKGLYRYQQGQFTYFGKAEGLASESIWSLHPAPDGSLWIGTCGGGLSHWRDGHMLTWTTKDGLLNDVICQILEDRHERLWLGSYGGVFRVNKADLREHSASHAVQIDCVAYGKGDGLPSIECQGGFEPSGCKSADGRLWFPTIKGLAVVDPDRLATNPVPPRVLIEQALVDGVAHMIPPLLGEGQPGAAAAVRIPPGKKQIEFRYTATSLTAPEKVRFRYWLGGLEPGWSALTAQRSASYSRLPPGNYQFRVMACNNDGVWNEEGAQLAFTVLPFFWQTNWFLTLSAFGLVAVIFASARIIVARRLKLKLERLEREQSVNRERARIAKDIHDDLGASLTEIMILSEFAQNSGAPLAQSQADIRKIAVKSRALTQLLDEIVWAVNPQRDTLENFVTYACSYAEDFLQAAHLQCRLKLQPSFPDMFLRTDVRHALFLVVKEALNNVVKHAEASEVTISMELDADKFLVSIDDNGKGFDPVLKPTRDSGPGGKTTTGEGLSSMRERVEGLGGVFQLHAGPGQGVSVRLRVPVGP